MTGFRYFLYWSFWGLEWLSLGALACTCFALDVSIPTANSPTSEIYLQEVVKWAQANPTLIGIPLAIFILVTRFTRWSLQSKSPESELIDRLITEALDKFREKCFPNVPGNVPKDYNRVTIFKHIKFKWWIFPFRGFLTPWGGWRAPWSGWLAVFQRSGHVTQTGGAVFLAPDDAEHCEGVAGLAWRSGAVRVGREDHLLPNLRDTRHVGFFKRFIFQILPTIRITNRATERFELVQHEIIRYAEMTHCLPSFVWQRIKNRKPNPTSILAIVLQDRHNVPWGVLVMDSCNQYECIDSNDTVFRRAFTELKNELNRLNVIV